MSLNLERLATTTGTAIKTWFQPYEARLVLLERDVAELRAENARLRTRLEPHDKAARASTLYDASGRAVR